MNAREIQESPLTQGKNEIIAYVFDASVWGTAPFTSPVVTVFDITDPRNEIDVTSTVTAGDEAISNNNVTTPFIYQLTDNQDYRVDIRFTDAGNNTYEPFLRIKCK